MSDPAKPRETASAAPNEGEGQATPTQQEKRDEPVLWPRDMNTAPAKSPDWGTDPEGLRDA